MNNNTYKLEKFRMSNRFWLIDIITNRANLTFEISGTDSWDRDFNVSIDEEGNIVSCSSLSSSINSLDYYIQMGKILETVKDFCANHGKEIYKRANEIQSNIDNRRNLVYGKETELVTQIKFNTQFDDLEKRRRFLVNDLNESIKKLKRLRREDKIIELESHIAITKSSLDEIVEKMEKINKTIAEVRETLKKEMEEIRNDCEKEVEIMSNLYNEMLMK